jgi:hypothetical protein
MRTTQSESATCHVNNRVLLQPRELAMVRSDAKWCIINPMGRTKKTIRQSVSLPSPLARRVKALAKSRKVSSNRILVELVETGLRSKEEEKRRFFELADLLSKSTDAKEQQELKKQLARMTFGE